jgi:hypothetical protein
VNHVTRVKISKAFGGAQRLGEDEVSHESWQGWTYKIQEIYVLAPAYVVPELSTGHPFRDKLKRIECDTPERDNIWVVQAFPHHGFFAKQLQSLSGDNNLTGGCAGEIPL